MDTKRNKRIVIWLSVATLLGVGGYFAYTKIIKPKLDEMKAKKAAEEAAKLAASTAASSTPSSGSSAPTEGSKTTAELFRETRQKAWDAKILAFSFQGKIYSTNTGQIVPNPFKTKEQLIAFQEYVLYTKKDSSIGTVDGIWGVKSAIALIKYFNDYGYYLRNK
jgi:hypothetical protein